MKKQNNLTKLFTCFLAAVMVICSLAMSSVTSVEAEAKDTLPFTDISSYGWAKDGIQYVYDQGMMTGKTATTFGPGSNLRRCDALVILWRFAGSPDVKVTGSYRDVPNDYYTQAVEWAKATGVYEGYSDGTFKPKDYITRQDFAILIMNTCNYLGRHSLAGDPESYKAVSDYKEVSDYAVPAIQWSYTNKIMGQGSTFKATKPVSRAEIAVMLQRMVQNTETKSDDVYSFLCMGIDYNEYSDANILVSINKTDKTITLTSIMRDMRIDYGTLGYTKFNNGFRNGGAPLLVKAVEKNFNIKVDDYAFVHFNQMAEIFDLIGGLDVDITTEEMLAINPTARSQCRYYGDEYKFDDLTAAGLQHLDGHKLVAYCRIRKIGNADMQRTERQRTVFTKMFNKLKQLSFPELISFFTQAMPKVIHSLSAEDLAQLITMFPTLRTYKLNLNRVPQDGNFSISSAAQGSMLIGIDFVSASALMKKMIYNN